MLVYSDTTRILIDTSPDMRAQLLSARVDQVDAILWTHDHADHCHGIDDVRQLMHRAGAPVRGLAREFAGRTLQQRFSYVFAGRAGYRPTATMELLPDSLRIGDIDIRVVDQPHGGITSAGLRFEHGGKSIGYATDFNVFTPEMRVLYADLDLWVIDALRQEPHPTHPHLDAVLGWIGEQRPARAILVHMDTSMDYNVLRATLPRNVEPGYDGMEAAA